MVALGPANSALYSNIALHTLLSMRFVYARTRRVCFMFLSMGKYLLDYSKLTETQFYDMVCSFIFVVLHPPPPLLHLSILPPSKKKLSIMTRTRVLELRGIFIFD